MILKAILNELTLSPALLISFFMSTSITIERTFEDYCLS